MVIEERKLGITPQEGAKKSKLKKKLGERCVYCSCENKLFLTIDHIVPLSQGGEDIDSNKQVACYTCNFLKGSMLDKDFRKYLKTLYILKDLCKIKLIFPAPPILRFNPNHYPGFEPKENGKIDEVKK